MMSTESKAFSMDRRAFIAATTAAVAGLASPSAFAAQVAEAPMVSVGYVGGLSVMERRSGGRQRLMAAERLTTSDPALIQSGALVSVRGLWQRPENRGRRGTYALNVLYAANGVAEKVPFYAWSHSVTKNGAVGDSTTSFVVPVDSGGSVDLVVKNDFGGEHQAHISFAVTSKPGAFMLDRGAYVIAILGAGDAIPDWSSIELIPESTASSFDRERGLIRMRTIAGTAEPSFDYVVVTFGSNTPEPVREREANTSTESTTAS
jgi:hypothetical protein